MLYLGIDLHRKQMTVSLRNEGGDVLLRRQVSTQWPKLEEFREQLRGFAAGDEKYVAIVCRNRSGAAVFAWSEPGEFPGADTGLPQFGRDRASGVDHQGGQPDGAVPAGGGRAAFASSRRHGADLVPADQTASRLKNCPGWR